jgi:hypothetical protein
MRRQNLQTFRRYILHPSSGHKNKCPGNTQRQKTGIGPLKLQQIATTLHVVISQKTVVFTVKVVKPSNFTQKPYLYTYISSTDKHFLVYS